MHSYAAAGRTILFATHYLEEAESSASRLVIIARGQILEDGTVQQIQQRYGETRVSFQGVSGSETEIAHFPGVYRSELQGERVILHTTDADSTVRSLISSALSWRDLEVKSNDLEDIFIKLVHGTQKETIQ
jgi:ABC-2 type transport system ATP-binding protein